MRRRGWMARLRAEQRRLLALLPITPQDGTLCPAVGAIAALRVFAAAKPVLFLQPGRTQPGVELPTGWRRCRYARELVDGLAGSAAGMLRGDHGVFDPARWAMAFGFAELLTQQLQRATGTDPLKALAGGGRTRHEP